MIDHDASPGLFDAIAKVITADDDNTALVEGLLGLVRDDRPAARRDEAPRRLGRRDREARADGVISRGD